jgi:hypothetical protein
MSSNLVCKEWIKSATRQMCTYGMVAYATQIYQVMNTDRSNGCTSTSRVGRRETDVVQTNWQASTEFFLQFSSGV